MQSEQNSVKILVMTPLEAVFILASFVAHAVTVTIYPLKDDGYDSDVAECDEEEDRDELFEESLVGKRKITSDECGRKKCKTC